MAARVRSDNDLPALRVRVLPPTSGASAEPLARFEVLRGRGPVTWSDTVPTRRLGLADWIRSARDVHESEFDLPEALARTIAGALARLTEPADLAYWLELPAPRGYLHFLPWERLLSPQLDRPLLRLPAHVLRPHAPGPTLRVVLLGGQPGKRGPGQLFDVPGTMAGLVRQWQTATGRTVVVEVFVTPSEVEGVRALVGADEGVLVHDSRAAGEILPGVSNNGWVTWIRTALAGRAADVVHIVSHGTLAGEKGAVALPPLAPGSGDPAEWPGTLSAVDLCTSLNRVGAWGLIITAPPRSHCPAALRDVADSIAQARPGVVAVQEMDIGSDDELRSMLRMLVDGRPPGRSLPGVLCCSHPSFVAIPDWDVPLCDSDGTSALIADTTDEVLSQDETPAWVAAGARTIEALQARVIPTDGTTPDPAAVAALEEVSKLFEAHVRTFAPRADPSGEVTT